MWLILSREHMQEDVQEIPAEDWQMWKQDNRVSIDLLLKELAALAAFLQ
jgi:hypothetical protein